MKLKVTVTITTNHGIETVAHWSSEQPINAEVGEEAAQVLGGAVKQAESEVWNQLFPTDWERKNTPSVSPGDS